MSRTKTTLYYAGYILSWTAGITAGGALLGAIVFPVAGMFIDLSKGPAELALAGAKSLGFLTFVWAPGVAIVLAFHRAYSNRKTASRPRP